MWVFGLWIYSTHRQCLWLQSSECFDFICILIFGFSDRFSLTGNQVVYSLQFSIISHNLHYNNYDIQEIDEFHYIVNIMQKECDDYS